PHNRVTFFRESTRFVVLNFCLARGCFRRIFRSGGLEGPRFASTMNQESTSSLFQRMGGQPAIARLLQHFYSDVRQHNIIGPIFNRQIHDWPAHLAKIGQFWARITGGPSAYSGQMPVKHFGLGLEPIHFQSWLGLWGANCRCYLTMQEAGEMIQLAEEIGARLRAILANRASMGFVKVEPSARSVLSFNPALPSDQQTPGNR
ncbi:MAG TPA: group III truncated hemoglobin, partial [Verrucomicrobiae bacterium]|nr:group III truncated hemoglobin [Verrucomicrobiae bacterium]